MFYKEISSCTDVVPKLVQFPSTMLATDNHMVCFPLIGAQTNSTAHSDFWHTKSTPMRLKQSPMAQTWQGKARENGELSPVSLSEIRTDGYNPMSLENRSKVNKEEPVINTLVTSSTSSLTNTTCFQKTSITPGSSGESNISYYELSLDEIAQRAISEWLDEPSPGLSNGATHSSSVSPSDVLNSSSPLMHSDSVKASDKDPNQQDPYLTFTPTTEPSLISSSDAEVLKSSPLEEDTTISSPAEGLQTDDEAEVITILDDDDDVIVEDEEEPSLPLTKEVLPPSVMPYIVPDSVCSLRDFQELDGTNSPVHECSLDELPETHGDSGSSEVPSDSISNQQIRSCKEEAENGDLECDSDDIVVLGCYQRSRTDVDCRSIRSKIAFMNSLGLCPLWKTTETSEERVNDRILCNLPGRLVKSYLKNDRIPLSRVRSLCEHIRRQPPWNGKRTYFTRSSKNKLS